MHVSRRMDRWIRDRRAGSNPGYLIPVLDPLSIEGKRVSRGDTKRMSLRHELTRRLGPDFYSGLPAGRGNTLSVALTPRDFVGGTSFFARCRQLVSS